MDDRPPPVAERMTARVLAESIWQAGVSCVDSQSLIRRVISTTETSISVAGVSRDLASLDRVVVVGAGKAGAGMAAGVEAALGAVLPPGRLSGWVNVPNNCVASGRAIHLHGARPAGVNEPTVAGVLGTEEILKQVACAGPNDLVLVLLSGGGSALLPAPISGITLEQKLAVTRFLSKAGATIQQLNTVRRPLSRVKGGGLLRVGCRAPIISLIISDVMGDPLDVIASGPTVPSSTSPDDALAVLRQFDFPRNADTDAVWQVLESKVTSPTISDKPLTRCQNMIIGNIETAIRGSSERAAQLGFEVIRLPRKMNGEAALWGAYWAEQVLSTAKTARVPTCLLAGGETVVTLAKTSQPRSGGRNQETALAALNVLVTNPPDSDFCLLAAGTDGEDGPTDAAGGIIDRETVRLAAQQTVRVYDHLAINNSYPILQELGGILKTGPTHTNVMDLHVGIVIPAIPRNSLSALPN